MPVLPITSLFVAAFGVAVIALSLPVTLRCIKVGLRWGTAPTRRFAGAFGLRETLSRTLLTLGLVEAHAAPAWIALAIGGALAAGRLLHALGMLTGSTPLRGVGMMLTYLALPVRLVVDAIHL